MQLIEMPKVNLSFLVDYYVISKSGARARFQRKTSLANILNAQSETAVLYYLRKLHPGTEIMIMNVRFM